MENIVTHRANPKAAIAAIKSRQNRIAPAKSESDDAFAFFLLLSPDQL